MTVKPAYEKSGQNISESGPENRKRNAVLGTVKNIARDRKVLEFLNKSSSAIRKIPAKTIRNLVEDLQIQKTDLEIQKRKLGKAQLKLREKLARYCDLYDSSPAAYFSIDNKGIILGANLTGANMLGVERGLLKDRLFSDFVRRDDREVLQLQFKNLLDTKAKQGCKLRFVKESGSEFQGHFECIVLSDENDNFGQFRAVVIDIIDENTFRQPHDFTCLEVAGK